jgi:hypothetical protein
MRIPRVESIAPEDRPFYSFQKRKSAGELATPQLDNQNRRLFGLPSQMAVREAFIADRDTTPDSFQGEWLWPHLRKG